MKIRSMRTDRRTDSQIDVKRDMTELIVAIRNSAEGKFKGFP
jgi:hypothetical protein